MPAAFALKYSTSRVRRAATKLRGWTTWGAALARAGELVAAAAQVDQEDEVIAVGGVRRGLEELGERR
jgi:hypothetical protein